jgi:hypothetical protein
MTIDGRKKQNLRKMVIDFDAPEDEATKPVERVPKKYSDEEWPDEE